MSEHTETLFTEDVNGQFTVVGKLVNDPDPECPVKLNGAKSDNDCNGAVYRFERGNHFQNQSYFDIYEGDPFALRISKFEHSDVVWSLAGEGPQCTFDTCQHAGYWVCEGGARENYDTVLKEKGLEEAQKWLREAGRLILEEFTAWCNGDCWGVVVEVTPVGDETEEVQAVWGHIGYAYAKEELEGAVKAEVKRCQAVVEQRTAKLQHHVAAAGRNPDDVGIVNLAYRYLGVKTALDKNTCFHGAPDPQGIVAAANKNGDVLQAIWDLDGSDSGSPIPFAVGYVLVGAT